MRFITAGDHFSEVAILRFYDFISRLSMERHVTGSTHLFTGHRLHISTSFLVGGKFIVLEAQSLPLLDSSSVSSFPLRGDSHPSEHPASTLGQNSEPAQNRLMSSSSEGGTMGRAGAHTWLAVPGAAVIAATGIGLVVVTEWLSLTTPGGSPSQNGGPGFL